MTTGLERDTSSIRGGAAGTHAAGAPLVWRIWVVGMEQNDPPVPVLTGIFGFPWRTADLQAKCLQQDPQRRDAWGTPHRVDRHHRSIPAIGCSCGIYGTKDPTLGAARRPLPAGRPIATGFVELGGRLLDEGDVLRAERAAIVGPLVLSAGVPPAPARWRMRAGKRLVPGSVTGDGTGYRVRWTARPDSGWDSWRRATSQSLAERYAVEVVGSAPRS